MEIKEFKEFINPEQKDYDLLGEHTIKKKELLSSFMIIIN